MANDLFVCDCGSIEHQLVVSRLDDDPEVYIHIHLASRSFWRRLAQAARHVAGYRCRYGNFDEIVLMPESAERLAKALMPPPKPK
jgi:hypothetical protein